MFKLPPLESLVIPFFNLPKLNKKQKPEIYLTHDNGGRVFKVEIEGKLIKILLADGDWRLEIKSEQIFIGKSPFNEMTKFSGGSGPEFDGNSILIKTEGKNYYFVGEVIYQFTALSTIVEFCSPVGNSDVPYAWARDDLNNIYLMSEKMLILGNSSILEKQVCSCDNFNFDPYRLYYDESSNFSEFDVVRIHD